MPDPAQPPISDAEWDLLEALWDTRAATAPQLAERLAPERDWAYSTVKTMLDRMVAKGLVRARKVGNVFEYAAAVEPADARRSAWRRFVAGAFGGAVGPALEFIASEARLTRRQREALAAMLSQQQKHEEHDHDDCR